MRGIVELSTLPTRRDALPTSLKNKRIHSEALIKCKVVRASVAVSTLPTRRDALPTSLKNKRIHSEALIKCKVVRARVELATHGFSVRCSTN